MLLIGFLIYGYSYITLFGQGSGQGFELFFLQLFVVLPLLIIGGVLFGVGAARLLQRSNILTLMSGGILLLVDLLITFIALRFRPPGYGENGTLVAVFAADFVLNAISLPLLIIGGVLVVRGLLRQRSNVLVMVGAFLLIWPLTSFIMAASYPRLFFVYSYGPVEMVLGLLVYGLVGYLPLSLVVPVLVIVGLCLLAVGLRGTSQTTENPPTISAGPPAQPLQGSLSPPPSTVHLATRDNEARPPAAVVSTSSIPEPVEAITEAAPTLSTQQSLDAPAPAASLLTPADTPSIAPSPPVVTLPKRGLSRRTVIVGLGLAGLTAAGGGIALWVLLPHPLYTYRGHSGRVYSGAWSPDGKRIASGSIDGTVQVWDAADGGHVYTYRGHHGLVFTVAWSPDGKRIASADGPSNNTAQVWDAVDGSHVYTYRGHSSWMYSVAWSPDGKRLASASDDGTVQVWLAER